MNFRSLLPRFPLVALAIWTVLSGGLLRAWPGDDFETASRPKPKCARTSLELAYPTLVVMWL
jgi:hypothetical protein